MALGHSAGRLNSSASSHAGSDVAWVYDLAGNRTSESDDTGFASTTYTPNALNEYASITGGRQEPGQLYDADGNLKQDGTWTYSYDGENRLIQMTKSGQTLAFTYDYLGRRFRKTVSPCWASVRSRLRQWPWRVYMLSSPTEISRRIFKNGRSGMTFLEASIATYRSRGIGEILGRVSNQD